MVKKGFTLIEALTLLFIFAVITVTFYAVFSTGTQQIIESKNRLGAIAVANEKMEIVHNLDYDAIGTKKRNADGSYSYGIPAGDILEDESIAVNTRTFAVHSFVQYIDDAYDGKTSGTTPLDTVPNDYKRVKIEVSWGVGGSSHTVSLVSTFVPKGVETNVGGGTMSVNVSHNDGSSGIGQATVRIVNTTTNPQIDLTTTTDTTGNVMFPAAPVANQSYVIAVSKNGYFPITTIPPYPTTSYHPVDVNASVMAGVLNPITIVTDRTANMTVQTQDPLGANMNNIAFHLSGGRKMGDTTDVPPLPVYEFNQDENSGSTARVELSGRSAGAYTVSLLNNAYRLLRLSTDEAIKEIFTVQPGTTPTVTAVIADTAVNAILFTITDQSTGSAIPNASVHVTNAVSGYDATVTTDRYGQAYVPTALPALSAGSYAYTVTVTGFSGEDGTVDVTSGMKTESVTMEAS